RPAHRLRLFLALDRHPGGRRHRAEAGAAADPRPSPAGARPGSRRATLRGGANALPGSPAGAVARRADRASAARATLDGRRGGPGSQPARPVRRTLRSAGAGRGGGAMIDDPMLLAAPLAPGLLALATHLPLGMQVLRRGIVFIDLAVAQFAALGAPVAGHQAGGAAATAAGSGFALAAAALGAGLGARWPRRREAPIGLVYVGGAAASVLWVSFAPHGAQARARTLAGDVLWVDWAGMAPLAVASL